MRTLDLLQLLDEAPLDYQVATKSLEIDGKKHEWPIDDVRIDNMSHRVYIISSCLLPLAPKSATKTDASAVSGATERVAP